MNHSMNNYCRRRALPVWTLFVFLSIAGAEDVRAQGLRDVRVELPEDGTTENFWLLKFRVDGLRMIVPESGPGKGQVYWYLLYTLENPSAEDRDVTLSVTASSERGKKYVNMYLPYVEAAIEQKEGRDLWGKADQYRLLASREPSDAHFQAVPLPAGEKRRSVAVFNRMDPNANQVSIRVTGLSNELKRVEGPDGTGLERRVLELKFHRSGDEFAVTRDSFRLVGREWLKETLKLGGEAEDRSR